jgi:hypothetical protein
MARRLLTECQRWRRQLDELGHRITALEQALPELKELAELPVATDDDKQAARAAEASLRLARRRRAELQGEHWIAVMERAGLFPNYTLLDDRVALDVGLSRMDPDTGTFETEMLTHQRNAARALREFAPGATFYANGHQVRVDAVDLGNKGEAVRTWAFCAACGHSVDVTEKATPGGVPAVRGSSDCGRQPALRRGRADPRLLDDPARRGDDRRRSRRADPGALPRGRDC